jgi:hypothetical protein
VPICHQAGPAEHFKAGRCDPIAPRSSTTIAGAMADNFGSVAVFLFLAGVVAVAGIVMIEALTPETRNAAATNYTKGTN